MMRDSSTGTEALYHDDLSGILVREAAGAVVLKSPAYAGQKYEKGSPGQAELSTLIYGKDQA